MREIIPDRLWVGHGGDLLDPTMLERTGIAALIHVALEEQLPRLSRELTFCHFALNDGSSNQAGVVAAAVATTAALVRGGIPTLVCCSGGMSRSLCVAAGAVALTHGLQPDEALARIATGHPHDIAPGFWAAVCAAVQAQRAPA